MNAEELLDRYEAYDDESLYDQAKPLFEQALAESADDAWLLLRYGYLQECHGRRALRRAVNLYERAISADPGRENAHAQLISTLTALGESGEAISRYRRRLADHPDDLGAHRLLARAYLMGHDYTRAAEITDAGLSIAPGDPGLVELRGDVYAATGRPDDALAWWRRASELATDDYGISMHYSAADLLERQNRLAEAAREWRFIIDWSEERGNTLDAEWPRRELARIEEILAAE